ncbi:hypothetical protein B0J11DRAFT_584633 [Dendryphion nanum]|uniref:Zn(2)-C6 fungal-type domain-containing protein n=1 Tax=Dendryphion nanum TaxID=256645 RepID=A0A9P9IC85_9PLEO|nr:hypothetical protein B0J11DRAFT_584633 [Dendryphion nanum]
MLQQPKKRTRASHPKVRTGCHTCKARRVKCDEQRPACQKCLSTGRKCDGYKNNREWIVITCNAPQPVTDGFDDDRSRRHFDYFRHQAVYELSWFFDGGEWGSLVLKQSHASAAVRHAVIALACSHEDFKDNMTVAVQAPQYAYAAQHYSKAIRHLIKETSDHAQESRVRALICGLLFISIEVLRGNEVAAQRHLDSCLKIAMEAQASMGMTSIPSKPYPLEQDRSDSEAYLSEDILPMFARLDVHVSLVLGRQQHVPASIPMAWDASRHIQIEDPSMLGFQNIKQACHSMLLRANRIHQFMQSYCDLYRHRLVRPIPMEVLADKSTLYNELIYWENAVQPLLNSPDRHKTWDKLALMRIHNRTGLTLLESSLHAEECLLDNYQSIFEDIVNFTAELRDLPYSSDDESVNESESSCSRASCSPSRSDLQASPGTSRHRARCFFLLDNGVIFSLYWTALKVRDGLLRRRAISLLECSTQEGVWIGPIQAAIAKRVVEVEEQQPYEQNPSPQRTLEASDIPEYIRVHSVETDIDKLRRRARLVLLQRLNGDDGGWSERVEWVTW